MSNRIYAIHPKSTVITPEMAKAMLKKLAKRHRKINQDYVEAFKDIILRGKFYLTTDAVTFNESMELTNGAMRLAALVAAGEITPLAKIEVLIYENWMDTPGVDQQRIRSLEDEIWFYYGKKYEKYILDSITFLYGYSAYGEFYGRKNGKKFAIRNNGLLAEDVMFVADSYMGYMKKTGKAPRVCGEATNRCFYTALLFILFESEWFKDESIYHMADVFSGKTKGGKADACIRKVQREFDEMLGGFEESKPDMRPGGDRYAQWMQKLAYVFIPYLCRIEKKKAMKPDDVDTFLYNRTMDIFTPLSELKQRQKEMKLKEWEQQRVI